MDSSATSQTRCLTVNFFLLPYSFSYSRVRSSPTSCQLMPCDIELKLRGLIFFIAVTNGAWDGPSM